MNRKLNSFWKMPFFALIIGLSFSCNTNEIDKLLNEMDSFVNKKNHEELVELIISNDSSSNIKAMAEIARFEIVIEELEKQRRNMSVKQLEKYLSITADAERKLEIIFGKGGRAQTVVIDPTSPYIGVRPTYAYYTGIGSITTKTRDSYSVSIGMNLGYDQDDVKAYSELSSRQLELQDFIRTYISGKYAADLKPENEIRLKQDIKEILNTRFLKTAKIRIIVFDKLEIIE
jgi:hypothetical protein